MLGRIPWRKILWALIGAHLIVLAYATWQFRRDQAINRLLKQRTLDAYAEAVVSSDAVRDRLLLNLGNLYFGRAQRTRQPAAARMALAYYREALRLNPGLMAAKKNFELAQRFLNALVPPRDPREPRPPERMQPSQRPLLPTDI